jgi:NAD(P)-dependent dehydrogenase (short-subunit alcohol dehydrogenase family)
MQFKRKTCVITGCNTGIGWHTANAMVSMGYDLVMLVRESEKSKNAYESIKKKAGKSTVRMYHVDLSSQKSIRSVAIRMLKEIECIDVLINNAGVLKRVHQMTEDDIEITMAVNFLAPYLLTTILLPLIKKSDAGRIVNLSSELYKKGSFAIENPSSNMKFNGNKAYADSKLMLMLTTREFSKRLQKDGITVNCLHPGVAGTEAFREYPNWFNFIVNKLIPKPATAAESVVYLASENNLSKTTGLYFYKKKPKEPNLIVLDEDLQIKAWEYAERLTKNSE